MDELADVFEAVSGYFALLAEPMRVRILHAVCQGEKSVSEIVAETGATQTNISRHLNSMYRAGALTRRKDGNFTYYGVRDRALTEICRTVCVHISARAEAIASGRSEIMELARDLQPSASVDAAAMPRIPVPGAGAGIREAAPRGRGARR